MTNKKGKRFKE